MATNYSLNVNSPFLPSPQPKPGDRTASNKFGLSFGNNSYQDAYTKINDRLNQQFSDEFKSQYSFLGGPGKPDTDIDKQSKEDLNPLDDANTEEKKKFNLGKILRSGISTAGKGIKSLGKYTSKVYGALGDFIPTKEGATNGTDQAAEQAIGAFRQIARKTAIGRAWDTTYKLGSQFGLNGTATDFNDKANGLTFWEHLGNAATKPIPFIGAIGTSIEKNDRSRLAGSSMYLWDGNVDRYGQKGDASDKFNVLFGGSKMKEGADKDKININTAIGIKEQGSRDILGAADTVKESEKLRSQLEGGWDYITPDSRIFAKSGTVLQFTKRTLSKHKIKKQQGGGQVICTNYQNYVDEFKEGGKVNVIPEGALHKNKHHLEEVDEKFEDVTAKGIPVIVEAKDGEVIQQAEVERQEIIFRLEVTKKLEELSKKHTDEAAIEAGKILVKEILYNTVDNTQEMI